MPKALTRYVSYDDLCRERRSVSMKIIETDVLVVGGGGAADRAAIEAHDAGAKVLLITKGRLGMTGATAYDNGARSLTI
jgi:succinate dehydrogenase/fumarate reductase flavoprotein subunit